MSESKISFPFIVNETYSLGYWLKHYGHYPASLPLCTYMDHGMTLFDKIPPHELENDAPLIFKFSPRLVDIYKSQSKKPVYNLINPAVYYRNQKGITKSNEAKGTLFFIGHSTPDIDDHTDWDAFIDTLKQIPDQYQPIDICLHPADMQKKVDAVFSSKGFRVVSAGPGNAVGFIENFYSILKNYRFVFSNLTGSYTFYSVEMGIPFSLYGDEPRYFNRGDDNIEKGEYKSYKTQQSYQKAKKLFTGLHASITDEQKEFVEYELGKHTTVSRKKAAYLLYRSLFIYFIKHPEYFRYIKHALSMGINERYKTGYRMLKSFYRRLRAPKDLKPSLKLGRLEKAVIGQMFSSDVKKTRLGGHPINFMQPYWFLHNYKEIFEEHVYYFESENKSPLIIDCGSNIGLSIIYFKTLFPESTVIGFEPDPDIFNLLQTNLRSFNFTNVEPRNEAVWTKNELLTFKKGYLEGHIVNEEGDRQNTITIKAIRLRELLEKYNTIDFLKIDIEGAELDVLEDCADLLPRVKNLFIEFHNNGGRYLSELTRLLSVLETRGFAYYMKEAYNFIPYPFSKHSRENMKDLWNSLNISAVNRGQGI